MQTSKKNAEKKGIIFDMDGTLWDSSDAVAKSWDEVVAASDLTSRRITKDDITAVMGMTMDKIAAKLFPDLDETDRIALLCKCCEAENDYLLKHGAKLYPNLCETLTQLKKDYSLYIVSNCQSGYIEAFLEYHKLWFLFGDIECYGNNHLEKSENILLLADRNKLTSAVYVGDIQADYESATAAGVKFIHAGYGFGSVTGVPRINSLSELPDIIKTVL